MLVSNMLVMVLETRVSRACLGRTQAPNFPDYRQSAKPRGHPYCQ